MAGIKPHTVITNQLGESKDKKLSIEKIIRKNICNCQILKNKCKYMDSNFWWYFPSARPKEHWLVLATIRDDTWNVFNMQYIDQFKKRSDYSDISCGGGSEWSKDPPTRLRWFGQKKIFEMSPVKWRPSCFDLTVLKDSVTLYDWGIAGVAIPCPLGCDLPLNTRT